MEENALGEPLPLRGRSAANIRKSAILKVLSALLVLGIVVAGIAMSVETITTPRPSAIRTQCGRNVAIIATALRQYLIFHDALPPAYTVDANGKPLHSWRTLLLPYLDQQALYDSIDLSKPWDDPVNAKARETAVDIYRCPTLPDGAGNMTTYLAIVSPDSAMQGGRSRRLEEISDGSTNTLVVIEVATDRAVPWMSPLDASEQDVMQIGPDSNLPHRGGVHAAFADGHVMFLRHDLTADQRRALISRAGGDKVDPSAF
jgi:prepilin-type processing-associated H-X9-DG protein